MVLPGFALATPLTATRTATTQRVRVSKKRLRRVHLAPRAVLPALADALETASDAATTAAAAAAAAADSTLGDGMSNTDPLLNKLALLSFVLGVYCTVGVIALSIIEQRNIRTGEQELKEWQEAGGIRRARKGLCAGHEDVLEKDHPAYEQLFGKRVNKPIRNGDKKKGTTAESRGLNRESRRIAAKQEAMEEKQRKMQEKLKEAREQRKAAKKKDNS